MPHKPILARPSSHLVSHLSHLTSHVSRLALLILILLAGISRVEAQGDGPQIDPVFRAYYDSHGGVAVLGLPLASADSEGGLKVQYTERARMEHHPENAGTPYEVQLGLLGIEQSLGRYFEPVLSGDGLSASEARYFTESRHTLRGAFLDYWNANGGLAQFGYPISEELQENGVTVQYFQRNRFEFHPGNEEQYRVLLGLLGREAYDRRVKVGEGQVSLPTYDYERAFVEGGPGGYPKLDFAAVGESMPRSYRLITLENRYLRLAIMPELGGRLYEVFYKPSGHSELYRNPVVKPAPFGARGWWLGVGGSEWAFPTDEHGLLEYLPWRATVRRELKGGATIAVSATDRMTGLAGTAEITLMPDEGLYKVTTKVKNPTAAPQRFQLWNNAMLAPGGVNDIPANSRWILPGNELIVHSSDDPGLPAPEQRVSWPIYNGRDLSNYGTWQGWIGGFVPEEPRSADFAGLYNLDADEGMIVSGAYGAGAKGLKIFGLGPRFDPHTYTDDDSSYAELWTGLLPTFWDYTSLQPGAEAGWSEVWQPVRGTGGAQFAVDWGVFNARLVGGGTRVDVAVTKPFAGKVKIRRGDQLLVERNVELQPGAPFSATMPGSQPIEVQVTMPWDAIVARVELRGR